MQGVTFSASTSFFKRVAKPEQLPNIAGASSIHVEPIKLKCKSYSIKKIFHQIKDIACKYCCCLEWLAEQRFFTDSFAFYIPNIVKSRQHLTISVDSSN